MRIKKGFVLREVAGEVMVIATEEASKDFRGLIKLNQTGKFIWEGLSNGLSNDEIALSLSNKYKIDLEEAREDTENFIIKIQEEGFLSE